MDFHDRRDPNNRPTVTAPGTGTTLFDPKPFFAANGQGKMFGDEKPSDTHRYPRGYTPERMNEVRNAPIEFENANEENFATTREGRQLEAGSHPPMSGHGAVREAQETLARSSMDLGTVHTFKHASILSDLGVPAFKLSKKERQTSETPRPLLVKVGKNLTGAWGQYSPFREDSIEDANNKIGDVLALPDSEKSGAYQTLVKNMENQQGEIRTGRNLPTQESAEQTLLHEFGHHNSIRVQGNSAGIKAKTGVKVAQEEARADDFAETHWNPDPRNAKRGQKIMDPNTSTAERKRLTRKGEKVPFTDKGQIPELWQQHGTKGSDFYRIPGTRSVPGYEDANSWAKMGGPKAHLAYLESRQTPLVTDRRNKQAYAANRANNGNKRFHISGEDRQKMDVPMFNKDNQITVDANGKKQDTSRDAERWEYGDSSEAQKSFHRSFPESASVVSSKTIYSAFDPLLETTKARHAEAARNREQQSQNRAAKASRQTISFWR